MINWFPKNKIGDYLHTFFLFVYKHKRIPFDKTKFNDYLFKFKTSNEIISPLRVFVTDKEFLKYFVKSIIGDKYNVPTISIIRNIKEIDSYEFPKNCCIKPTHASGRVIFKKNNSKIYKVEIKKWFSLNYYDLGREANYKFLKPKIIVEPLIFKKTNISDYKFFVLMEFQNLFKLTKIDFLIIKKIL